MTRQVSKVRCREIAPPDLDAVADLLTRGFPGRTRDYWLRGLYRQSVRDIPENCSRYGFLLENNGTPVGVLLLLFTTKIENNAAFVRCNVSSWYVEPQFRNYATLLTSMAQKNRSVTYINISPAAATWPIIEAQGFTSYCSGLFFSLPLLSRVEAGIRLEMVAPRTAAIEGLPDGELELLRSHAQYGCLAFVCHSADGPLPFVMVPKRVKHGRFPLPAMQLVYCRAVAHFARCAGAIGWHLLRLGKPIAIIDANGPVPGLAGIYSQSRGRKYFRGPHPPRLADLTETELVLYGP